MFDVSLFDLVADPGERRTSPRRTDVVTRLQALIERARADLGDSLTKRPAPACDRPAAP
jgi:arylsulfatase